MSKKILLLGLFLILSLGHFSCTNVQKTTTSSKEFKVIKKQFTQKKYDGLFRTDSLFISKIEKAHQQLKIQNLSSQIDSLLFLKTEWSLLQNNLPAAQKTLNTIKAKYPSALPMEYHWLNAYALAFSEKSNLAKKELELILKTTPLSPTLSLKTNWLMASIYEEEGQDSLAIIFYKKAIENGLMKKEVDYYVESIMHLGNVLYTQHKISESNSQYIEGLAVAQQHQVRRLIPFGYYHLGKVAENQNKSKEALLLYRQGLTSASELGKAGSLPTMLLNKKIEALEKR